MARLPRYRFPEEGVYHVTVRGTGPIAIFRDDHDRFALLTRLAEVIPRQHWVCHVYCLMTTHYHLVVGSKLVDLSAGMHRLNGLYAQRFNRRHGRSGHLLQGRFGLRVIEEGDYFESACNYVVENPVRAGICKHPAEWPWGGIGERLV